MNTKIIQILSFVLISHIVNGHSLETFFNSLGAEANVTAPTSFHDQAAGYYTGGGLMMRQKNTVFQPINISPPSYGAGCSGIDAYTGSISFMKGEQLVAMIRQMGTQAGTYAFQLALKTMAPQVENLLSQLRKIALDANSLMMGDCRQVQQIFAAALPKGSAFQEHACIDAVRGGGEDWFGAKQACQKPEEIADKVSRLRENPAYKDMMQGEFNLTWHILKKLNAQGSLLKEDMEFWLTMVGTIIQRKAAGGNFIHTLYSGKAADEVTWSNLLKGGSIHGLTCGGDEECLTMRSEVKSIDEGLGKKIKKRIDGLQEKYLNNTKLSDEDITFLNDVADLPLWKYIQVLSARGGNAHFEAIHDYIALRLLLSQLNKIVSEIDAHMHILEANQMEAEKIKEFREHLSDLKMQLRQRQGPLTQQTMFQLNKIIEAEEKHIRLTHSLAN